MSSQTVELVWQLLSEVSSFSEMFFEVSVMLESLRVREKFEVSDAEDNSNGSENEKYFLVYNVYFGHGLEAFSVFHVHCNFQIKIVILNLKPVLANL